MAARYSHRINGYTGLVVAKLDILDNFDEIQLCAAYELDGERVWDFPGSAALLERCRPIYETHPGWRSPTSRLRRLEDLPRNARSYLDRLEELVGCADRHRLHRAPSRRDDHGARPDGGVVFPVPAGHITLDQH